MPRILVGEFGEIPMLGLRAIFRELGAEIVGECRSRRLVTLARSLRPDVVVVDHDRRGGLAIAHRVATRCQPVTVIACSLERPIMRVYPRSGGGASFIRVLSTATLVETARG